MLSFRSTTVAVLLGGVLFGVHTAVAQCKVHEDAKLTALDPGDIDNFGNSVAASGNTVVVGAIYDDHAGGINAGSAYVYRFNGTNWVQEQKLTASDTAHFGQSVSISGGTGVVGNQGGSAYVFVRSGTEWTLQAKLTASDAATNDAFERVAISGDTVVVGARAGTITPAELTLDRPTSSSSLPASGSTQQSRPSLSLPTPCRRMGLGLRSPSQGTQWSSGRALT
jgi:hypothetical protein